MIFRSRYNSAFTKGTRPWDPCVEPPYWPRRIDPLARRWNLPAWKTKLEFPTPLWTISSNCKPICLAYSTAEQTYYKILRCCKRTITSKNIMFDDCSWISLTLLMFCELWLFEPFVHDLLIGWDVVWWWCLISCYRFNACWSMYIELYGCYYSECKLSGVD